MKKAIALIVLHISLLLCISVYGTSHTDLLENYNVVWNSQSEKSPDSMPLGGGDIGLNVWVENSELLFYIGRSGTFDENNQMLKLGRVRVRITPNPFSQDGQFRQELKLRQGYVEILGNNPGTISATIKVWVEVFRPVISMEEHAYKGSHEHYP